MKRGVCMFLSQCVHTVLCLWPLVCGPQVTWVWDSCCGSIFSSNLIRVRGCFYFTSEYLWSRPPPHLPRAEQDRFGMMTLLRLIGRLAQESVSDPVPERVALHSAYRERERHSGLKEVKQQSDSRVTVGEQQSHPEWSWGLLLRLLFLLQNCDPELVYMCWPDKHKHIKQWCTDIYRENKQ